jgi:hypothetical protein
MPVAYLPLERTIRRLQRSGWQCSASAFARRDGTISYQVDASKHGR